MRPFRCALLAALAILAVAALPRIGLAQDPAKKDEALEKLLEKLDDPKPPSPGTTDPAQKPDPKPGDKPAEAGKKDDALEKLLEKLDAPQPADAKPGDASKPEEKKPGAVGAKDQSLDKLLEGLGGPDDKPAPDDKKQGGGQGPADDKQPPPPGGGDQAKPNPLDDAEKKLDDLLEEKTGRKPKKKSGQGQGQGQRGGQGQGEGEGDGGPLGDLIKQMRDVEDRLGKPDTGTETRKKQTEIVKNLDTLLEQVRNSSSQGQAMRMIRGQGKPGGPPKPGQGNQPGATSQDGVGLSKPTTPKTPPKPVELAEEAWGRLPQQFRDDQDNVLNERALPSKEEMIRLYYLSLGKKSAASKGD